MFASMKFWVLLTTHEIELFNENDLQTGNYSFH